MPVCRIFNILLRKRHIYLIESEVFINFFQIRAERLEFLAIYLYSPYIKFVAVIPQREKVTLQNQALFNQSCIKVQSLPELSANLVKPGGESPLELEE
jgi:formate dehydrogenase maturation protein FdhE